MERKGYKVRMTASKKKKQQESGKTMITEPGLAFVHAVHGAAQAVNAASIAAVQPVAMAVQGAGPEVWALAKQIHDAVMATL